MKLSVVIPAHDESESIKPTLTALHGVLTKAAIPFEIVVINDHSLDNTLETVQLVQSSHPEIFVYSNPYTGGFGNAVRFGLENFTGDCVAIMMADASEDPSDLVLFYNEMKNGNYDCVFGSRFIKGGKIVGYPKIKLVINRMANTIVRLSIGVRYNDFTNAFKLYKRETIYGLRPLLSPHFNLTLELPLKAVVRGYSYCVIPNAWFNRKTGHSKLKIKEMGSRYFFILLYCLIEKFFSRGDYHKAK